MEKGEHQDRAFDLWIETESGLYPLCIRERPLFMEDYLNGLGEIRPGKAMMCEVCGAEYPAPERLKAGMVLSRSEAVRLISQQLRSEGDNKEIIHGEKPRWHYGKQELRALLDAIYGGPPTSDDEKIW